MGANKWVKRVTVTVALVTLPILALALAGCSGGQPLPQPSPQPVVCATYQAPDGTWMEEDNEPVDDDPCDRLPDSPKSPSIKPTTKKPAPATTKPAPRVTRR